MYDLLLAEVDALDWMGRLVRELLTSGMLERFSARCVDAEGGRRRDKYTMRVRDALGGCRAFHGAPARPSEQPFGASVQCR